MLVRRLERVGRRAVGHDHARARHAQGLGDAREHEREVRLRVPDREPHVLVERHEREAVGDEAALPVPPGELGVERLGAGSGRHPEHARRVPAEERLHRVGRGDPQGGRVVHAHDPRRPRRRRRHFSAPFAMSPMNCFAPMRNTTMSGITASSAPAMTMP